MNLKYEKAKLTSGFRYIIGCDEVGRGCLAGPVVAAAVVFDLNLKMKDLRKVRDSKLLSSETREELDPIIKQHAVAWSIAEVSSKEIDEINIHNASLLAMRKALEGLSMGLNGSFTAVDGKFKVPALVIEQEAVVDGDNKVFSIAAASIIAKVYRDALMQKLHLKYPLYNLKQHKGYATVEHRQKIFQNGLSAVHRLSFCSDLSH